MPQRQAQASGTRGGRVDPWGPTPKTRPRLTEELMGWAGRLGEAE
jgi:hypothetical protein